MIKNLLLLRHGDIGTKHRHRFIGRLDVSLTALGRRQASAAAKLVCSYQPQRCLCSPLKRCIETARVVAEGSELKIEIMSDLREIDFGRWEKKTFDEICETDADAVKRWTDFQPAFSFPDGESLKSFLSRVHSVAMSLVSCAEETVLVVTHGGVIRALICHFLRLEPCQYVLFDVQPGALTTLKLFGDKGVLEGMTCPRLP
ncbi:MAG: alpha-ribazole phosphatase [Verrucomicrobia bacterium]|nr:alpha-ribazole phosphatase [Verrucomicrobiota bacterium]